MPRSFSNGANNMAPQTEMDTRNAALACGCFAKYTNRQARIWSSGSKSSSVWNVAVALLFSSSGFRAMRSAMTRSQQYEIISPTAAMTGETGRIGAKTIPRPRVRMAAE